MSKLTQEQIDLIENNLKQIEKLAEKKFNKGFWPGASVGIVGAVNMPIAAGASIFSSIINKSRSLAGVRKDRAMLDEYLVAQGYVKKNRSIDYARFYDTASIPQGSWNRYYNGANKEAPVDTLLKIVLALRMPTKDAIDFMTSAGAGFYNGSRRDMLILAFIDTDYCGLTEVVDIQNAVFDLLEYYLQQPKAEKFKNLYDF